MACFSSDVCVEAWMAGCRGRIEELLLREKHWSSEFSSLLEGTVWLVCSKVVFFRETTATLGLPEILLINFKQVYRYVPR